MHLRASRDGRQPVTPDNYCDSRTIRSRVKLQQDACHCNSETQFTSLIKVASIRSTHKLQWFIKFEKITLLTGDQRFQTTSPVTEGMRSRNNRGRQRQWTKSKVPREKQLAPTLLFRPADRWNMRTKGAEQKECK
ncbi:hypothetical protein K0M31_010698 [Melipona bicolor]|uniref:Uncharacterized protein n=1 Tax=Melipona bicolor TaxID=60889 RepID=A0AA40KHV1_9HYME|nr:hypothetical protein K0M31_010698 [Melipona bicolor]